MVLQSCWHAGAAARVWRWRATITLLASQPAHKLALSRPSSAHENLPFHLAQTQADARQTRQAAIYTHAPPLPHHSSRCPRSLHRHFLLLQTNTSRHTRLSTIAAPLSGPDCAPVARSQSRRQDIKIPARHPSISYSTKTSCWPRHSSLWRARRLPRRST